MCGIAGIIQSSSRWSLSELQRMTSSLAHRGPDGERYWQNKDGKVLLGHRRLAIIDLSDNAAQPMHYRDQEDPANSTRYTIIHNGEIYNYIELKKELLNEGYQFTSQSDTEVILAAYDHWKEQCVHHFDGMFSFAIWDQQEQELFAARDRFGEKPFFYCVEGESLLFASEMKALWAAGIPRQPNQKMLFNFITIGYTDNPARPEETFFENINKLPAASWMYYMPATREMEIERYWDIDVDEQDSRISNDEALQKFNALFNASVRRRLRSDVSIGSSLSGGLDSSSIIAITSQLNNAGPPLSSFTAIFPGFVKDEAVFANEVASQYHLNQHQIHITPEDLIKDWDTFNRQQEEPVASASAFAQYKVYELAAQHGVKVLLDGQGADETLAGYHKYYKWYWQELFQKRKLIRSREIQYARQHGVKEKFGVKNIMAALFPDLASVILERQYLVHALSQNDLDKDFVRLQSKEAYYATPELSNLNGLLHFNTCIHGLEELLRYADRSAMAFGREVRLPFLNHELVEFIFSLPSRFKIHEGWTKWILRQSMHKVLPDAITWRKDKTGFEPPQKEWMEHSRVREMIHASKEKLVKEKILKSSALSKNIQPASAYEAREFDWRYFAAAAYL